MTSPPAPPAPPAGPTASATLLYAGGRAFVGPEGTTLGRSDSNDVVIPSDLASRKHARVYAAADGYRLADLGSSNGTYLNGERFAGEERLLRNGDTIQIGELQLRFLMGQETRFAQSAMTPMLGTQVVNFNGQRLAIGRDPSNDVVLGDPNVSRYHAEVVRGANGQMELRDLGSRNGTRLDGQLTTRAVLGAGSTIGVGPFQIVFDGSTFMARDDRGALRYDVQDVSFQVKSKLILKPLTLSIAPGEFCCIIGESGSGKSTLIKMLAGVTQPSSGAITVNGEPVNAHLTDIGYVPQDEIVHPKLTVREALVYSAKLRLPSDASRGDIEEAVHRVLVELSLEEHADTQIGSLSGGQRKRAGVASELLNRPSLLLLDEATTGLDPGLETRMMELMRQLADNDRAVITITHATKNLGMCDKVIVMGRGGDLAFVGSPDEAKRFFRTDEYDGIYRALDEVPAIQWRQQFEAQRTDIVQGDGTQQHVPAQQAAGRAPRGQRGSIRQGMVLASRYLKNFVRDRRNLALLIGQVPVIAFAIVLLFKGGLFGIGEGSNPTNQAMLLFLVATTAIWVGSIDASREVIKEKSVFLRERAVGVKLSSYLFSKLVVLFGLAAVQTTLLTLIVFAFHPLKDAPSGALLAVWVILLLTSFVSVGVGLLVSASVNTQDQATSFIPLVLIPQLLFAGAVVPVEQMNGFVSAISKLVYSQWTFAGLGGAIDMNERLTATPQLAQTNQFGLDFFNLTVGGCLLILFVFLLLFVAAVWVQLWRARG
jgi:ABC transport system ATP-binding/permease protein